mgnify:FL=1
MTKSENGPVRETSQVTEWRSSPIALAAREKLLTIAEAAKALGVYEWALRRAVKRGIVPHYAPFNSRKLVRLSEVIAAIEASRTGSINV